MDNRSGIHINDVVISRLSGPVFIAYLKPPSNRPDLPLALLLGDTHGQSGLCQDCKNPECYQVFDRDFLLQFDKIAEKYPIDFFTESNELGMRIAPTHDPNQVLSRFLATLPDCHNVAMRRERRNKCPTKYVRWHHSDPRQNLSTFESQMDVAHMVLEEWLKVLDLDEIVNKNLENIPSLSEIVKRVVEDETFIYFGVGARLSLSTIGQYISDLHQIVLDNIPNIPLIIDQVVDYMWQLLERNSSILIKQLRKLDDGKDWKSIVKTAVVEEISDLPATPFELLMKTDSSDLEFANTIFSKLLVGMGYVQVEMATIQNIRPLLALRDVIDALSLLGLIIPAVLVDIYTLARMLKMPKDNDRAVLMLGYFGKSHCQSMAAILMNLMNYSLIYDNETEYGDNCIIINKPIYLSENIEELARKRYSQHPEQKEKYLRVIRDETRSRHFAKDVNQRNVRTSRSRSPRK